MRRNTDLMCMLLLGCIELPSLFREVNMWHTCPKFLALLQCINREYCIILILPSCLGLNCMFQSGLMRICMFDAIPTTIRHTLLFVRYYSLIIDSMAELKMPRDM